MAYFTAREERPAELCQRAVQECDVYVGIFGFRYGQPVRDKPEVSHTELEYQAAVEAGIPRLLFLLDSEASVPRGLSFDKDYNERQERFRAGLSDDDQSTRATFRTDEQLELLLYQSLVQFGDGPSRDGPSGMAGHVLLTHFIDYPLLGSGREAAFEATRRRLTAFVRRHFLHADLTSRGDEFLLFTETTSESPRELQLLFLLGMQLGALSRGAGYGLGFILHSGFAFRQYQLLDTLHVVGPVMAEAELLASFAHEPHFTLTPTAFNGLTAGIGLVEQGDADALLSAFQPLREIWPASGPERPESYECRPYWLHDFTKTAHLLYSFRILDREGVELLGREPAPYHHALIEFRPRSPQRTNPFLERLVESDVVHVVGLTNENLAHWLRLALARREEDGRGFWTQLHVTFPTREVLATVRDQYPSPEAREILWLQGKQAVTRFLLGQGTACIPHWTVAEFDGSLPFVGNLFSRRGAPASVRVAQLLPGLGREAVVLP